MNKLKQLMLRRKLRNAQVTKVQEDISEPKIEKVKIKEKKVEETFSDIADTLEPKPKKKGIIAKAKKILKTK
jgi:hypothetical protein